MNLFGIDTEQTLRTVALSLAVLRAPKAQINTHINDANKYLFYLKGTPRR